MKKNILIAVMAAFLVMGATRTAIEFTTTGVVSKVDKYRDISALNAYDNVYMIVHSSTQNMTWDTSLNGGAGAYAAITAVTHANAAISLTDYRAHAIDSWYMTFPAAMQTQDGGVTIRYYDNATPAASDVIRMGRYGNMRGGQLQSLNDL